MTQGLARKGHGKDVTEWDRGSFWQDTQNINRHDKQRRHSGVPNNDEICSVMIVWEQENWHSIQLQKCLGLTSKLWGKEQETPICAFAKNKLKVDGINTRNLEPTPSSHTDTFLQRSKVEEIKPLVMQCNISEFF